MLYDVSGTSLRPTPGCSSPTSGPTTPSTRPVAAALMAGEFAVHLEHGDVYSVDEGIAWLQDSAWRSAIIAAERPDQRHRRRNRARQLPREHTMSEHRVAIIGAGTSGVAAAVALADRGIESLLIDRADRIGSSSHCRYDRLRLNTGRRFLRLPHRPLPQGHTDLSHARTGDRASRAACACSGIGLRLECPVERLDRTDGHWRLTHRVRCGRRHRGGRSDRLRSRALHPGLAGTSRLAG